MNPMNLRAALLALLACLVAACGQPDKPREREGEQANPLLWEIARADGTTEGWLLGTIHALPDGAEWRNRTVDGVVADADILAVEIADVGDGRAMASAFLPLASSAGQPPLTARVPPEQRERLAELVGDTRYRLDDFDRIESWGAALILAQTVDSGADALNGVDRALIREFPRNRTVELEGAHRQFEAFDSLSEGAQRAMLAAIVEESQADPAELRRPIDLYLAGDDAGLERLSHEGMLGNAEIREVLLTRRNADWMAQISRLLESDQRPLIAVGAAHMVGEDGLVALLEAQGYRVTRLN
ncbi:MAG: TraB/GumN family protein [Citromicrobium sp.]|nr:TraB/GumN family protein [Citromicrobium sp.]